MSKLKNFKEAMKNTPPERLAKVEYQSHLYQIVGIIFVSIVLLMKGYWYIIFALIFGVGVSYSQGITAYQKYNIIMSLKHPDKLEDYEKDISFTRRRGKIIQSVFPQSKLIAACLSVIVSILIIDPTSSRWILSILYPLTMLIMYIGSYFLLFYHICYPIYKKRLGK